MNGEQPPGSIEDQNTEDENLCEGLKLMEVNALHHKHNDVIYCKTGFWGEVRGDAPLHLPKFLAPPLRTFAPSLIILSTKYILKDNYTISIKKYKMPSDAQ